MFSQMEGMARQKVLFDEIAGQIRLWLSTPVVDGLETRSLFFAQATGILPSLAIETRLVRSGKHGTREDYVMFLVLSKVVMHPVMHL